MTDNFFCPYEMVGGQMQGLKELEKENNKNCKEDLKIINLKTQYFDRDPFARIRIKSKENIMCNT